MAFQLPLGAQATANPPLRHRIMKNRTQRSVGKESVGEIQAENVQLITEAGFCALQGVISKLKPQMQPLQPTPEPWLLLWLRH